MSYQILFFNNKEMSIFNKDLLKYLQNNLPYADNFSDNLIKISFISNQWILSEDYEKNNMIYFGKILCELNQKITFVILKELLFTFVSHHIDEDNKKKFDIKCRNLSDLEKIFTFKNIGISAVFETIL